MMLRSALVLICLATGPQMLLAADLTQMSRDAADRLAAAEASLAAADTARDRVDALSRTIRAYEDGLEALREGLRQAALREDAIQREFDAAHAETSRLLGVMMGINPAIAPVGLIHPGGALGAAEAGIMLTEITPAMQARVADLRSSLDELALAQRLQEDAAGELQQGLLGAQTARAALSQAISGRTDLPRRFTADPDQMERLRASAETLQDFASGLIELAQGGVTDDPVRSFSSAKGTLDLPVRGRLLRGFDQADAAGIRRPGLLIAAPALSLVSAPWPGTIRYAGPLLDYGDVVILEPQQGYMLVLAGLARTFGEVGEVVRPGAPLGLMGGQAPDPDTFLRNATIGAGSSRPETLYIELRQDADPVDPAPWFAETKDVAE